MRTQLFLTTYALTSPSPIQNPELFSCCRYPIENPNFFQCPAVLVKPRDNAQRGSLPLHPSMGRNSLLNNTSRLVLLALIAIKGLIFIMKQEYMTIYSHLKRKDFRSEIPWVYVSDILIFSLTAYIAIDNSSSVSRDGIVFDTDV